jgi:F0F1-type ATP synthase membrane subunit b/b'
MSHIFIFALGASIVGTIFLVSIIELLFTIKRRRGHAELERKIKELKLQYNESVNKLVIEDESKLEEAEEQVKTVNEQLAGATTEIKEEYEAKIDKLKSESEKALASAKARAKKLEEEAKMKADEYLATRQKEVEHDLVELVLTVAEKVLPEGLEYTVQRDLVLKALQVVKDEGK